MFDGIAVLATLRDCGITHVVWVPDSTLGTWESALAGSSSPKLVRVCREGEAFALAAGLHLGGKKPLIVIQCTGLFEAGDSLRNAIHDIGLPLFMVVGVRNYHAHQESTTGDSCPVFTEPILRAWQIPYVLLDRRHSVADLAAAYRQAQTQRRPGAVLLAE